MKTICIYHSRDLDGWMSAAIVKHWFMKKTHKSEELEFLGWDYGDEIPDLSAYDKVIICDVGFPQEEMHRLFTKLDANFIWIDHHLSSMKDIIGESNLTKSNNHYYDETTLFNGMRQTDLAACELTWKYLFPEETMPEIVRLLGRYDCFGHKTKSFDLTNDGYKKAEEYLTESDKLKEFIQNKTSTDGYSLVHYANTVAKRLSEEQKVLEFQYGARQCMSNYDDCYNHLISESNETIQTNGWAIYSYLCTEAKQTYTKAFPIQFYKGKENSIPEYHNFLCVNQERFNPINFGIDYHKEGYDGFACFWYKNGQWTFSLYNDNGEVDCSAICKGYGGGGHQGAAGFVIDDIKDLFDNRVEADKMEDAMIAFNLKGGLNDFEKEYLPKLAKVNTADEFQRRHLLGVIWIRLNEEWINGRNKID